jgi:hypothetical protein
MSGEGTKRKARYVLPDAMLEKIEKNLEANAISYREFFYAAGDYIHLWIVTSKPTKIYRPFLTSFREWDNSYTNKPNVVGVYTNPHTSEILVLSDPSIAPEAFVDWLLVYSVEEIVSWCTPIFPALPGMDMVDFRKSVLEDPHSYVSRYADVRLYVEELVWRFSAPISSPEHQERRFGHLLFRWAGRIDDWLIEEHPPSVVGPLIEFCSRTRHQAAITKKLEKIGRGTYQCPFDNTTIIYKGGNTPLEMRSWIDEYGASTVHKWKINE